VRAVRLPGRETRRREALITRMQVLVETLLHELDAEWHGSYGFFGHSLGARIAFELTRELARAGRPLPCQLWLSGSRAPHLPRSRVQIHDLPDAEFVRELCRLYDSPPEVFEDRELMGIYLPVIRADLALLHLHEHRPGPPLAVPLSVFGGVDDPILFHSDLEAWSEHTKAAFRIQTFPGKHLYLKGETRAPLLKQLSDDLSSWLEPPCLGAERRA
jgi:medium-chain acyl-[acyl-carrier-protein] hydrolase